MNEEKVLPEKKFKAGAINVTIWKNERQKESGEEFSYYSISIDRRYKNKNGEWQSTNSLRVNDLPKAILVLNKAYEYLVLKEQETTEEVVL